MPAAAQARAQRREPVRARPTGLVTMTRAARGSTRREQRAGVARAGRRRCGSGSCARRARRRRCCMRRHARAAGAVAASSASANRATSLAVGLDDDGRRPRGRAHRAARRARASRASGSAVLQQRPVAAVARALATASPARRAGRPRCRSRCSRSRLAGRSTTPPPVASTMSVRSDELGEHRLLAVAEARLALDLEDRRDRHAEPLLELVVGVDERLAQPARELPAERRLARAGQADQKQIAPMQLHRGIVVEIDCAGRARRARRARSTAPR